MHSVTYLQESGQKRVTTPEPQYNLYMAVSRHTGLPYKKVSLKSDEGALRYTTPKIIKFHILTDFSALCSLAPSSSADNFKWDSIGNVLGIISCKN